MKHDAVMVAEVLRGLAVRTGGCYVDCTYGRGGHTTALLEQGAGRVVAFDKDPAAVQHAREACRDDSRLQLVEGSFVGIRQLDKVDGMLFDLGVSSPLLGDASRGFGFQVDGPLDMRYAPVGETAAEFLQRVSEAELADVLWRYGDERASRRIARAVVAARPARTWQLAAVVKRVLGGARRRHPATKVFLALRLYINRELEELELALACVPERLVLGGRVVVIAFHSLEDRIVKRFMRAEMRPLGRFRAGAAEVAMNPRARSAVLRVATV